MKNFSIDKINLDKDYIKKIKSYNSEGYHLILDIGGTKTLIRIIDNNDSVCFEKFIHTDKLNSENPDIFAENIHSISKKIVDSEDLNVISISTPGAVNNKGEIIKAPNLGWVNLKLKKVFEDQFNCKTILINDCNAGALAEIFENPELKNLMYITVSSGIGGGLILNNKLFLGENFSSAEIGHLVIAPEGKECICGNKGCVQVYCSGKGLYKEFKKYYPDKLNEKEVLSDLLSINNELFENDLEDSFKKLAQLIAIFSGLLDMKSFLLGGGVMNCGEKILTYLNKWVNYYSFKINNQINIQRANSFPNSSIYGAEIFAKIFEYESQ